MGADPINGLFGDCIGGYHAPVVATGQAEGLGDIRRGNVAYYDAHVELVADPMPGRVLARSAVDRGAPDEEARALLGPFVQQILAQRGIMLTLDGLLRLFD